MPLTLVLGGTRSGKSEVAERLAAGAGAPVHYVATATPTDPEVAERIARHRARRPAGWRTVETADVPAALEAIPPGDTALIDGLAPWLAHLGASAGLWTGAAVAPLGPAGEAAHARALAQVERLAAAAAARPGLTVVVAEESGLGLVPTSGADARRYLDLAGDANQVLARHAREALLVVAGRALPLAAGPALQAPAALDDLRRHGDTMVPEGDLDLAVNVLPGPPPWLREVLAAALDRAAAYPDERPATAALARLHRRAPEEVLLTNGSAEAFWLLAAALRPRLAAVAHPGFTEPEVALRTFGHPVARCFRDPEGGFRLDPAAVPEEADLVVVGNPNNPTGTLDPAEVLARLARPGRVLVVDEAFMEFCPGEPESLTGRAGLPGVVVVRSLTKAWGLAGVRAGYLLAPAELVAALRARRQPWSVNALACAALEAWARAAWQGPPPGEALAAEVAAARGKLAAALARLPGVRVWPSVTNFLLLRVPGGQAVREALARQGIAVRPCHTFPGLGHDYLRVAVRRPEDNRRLVAALAGALRGPAPAASPEEGAWSL